MTTLTLAVLQSAFTEDMDENIQRVARLVREAAASGGQVILPPELFQGPYFCKSQEERFFAMAYPVGEHPVVAAISELARELGVVIPTSIFERDGPHYYNSLVMVDADGELLGTYRKSHIPDGPGYQEKFYFRPGNTGFRVWNTTFGRIGVGICWDQWFPEAARAMALMGAEALLYPTAIGAEPQSPEMDTKDRWQLAMQGHSVSNVIPVAAANRVGDEAGQVFYGSSFLTDETGAKLAELDRSETGFAFASYDLEAIREQRAAWGFFRDRRPEFYGPLTQL